MKVSDYIAKRLCRETDTVFGYQGSSVSHLIDSVCREGLLYVQNYHEQASSFAACGYAEESGKLGVALSCSGPGATNLITGIANAYYDSLPCLFVCGQVSTHESKDNESRQNGFQETKITRIVESITKYCVEVRDPEDVQVELEKCIQIAKDGRPGPTLLSIPHNIQTAEIEPKECSQYHNDEEFPRIETQQIIGLLQRSRRPLLVVGGGARKLKESSLLISFLRHFQMPYVCSLRGLNCIPYTDKYVGMIGVYGNREANLAVYSSDLLLVVGSRLDGRQTGGVPSNFAPSAKVIHIDIDSAELNRDIHADCPIRCDCEHFFKTIMVSADGLYVEYADWWQMIEKIRKHCQVEDLSKTLIQYRFISYMNELFKEEKVIVGTDVGQNQMWVGQTVRLSEGSTFLTSGGHGTMGYSVPASIGAAFAGKREKHIIAYVGDGGFQMNIQELETIAREDLDITIVVFVNNCLGLIRDYQGKALENRQFGSVKGFSVPDLSKIARAYGFRYNKVQSEMGFETISKSKLKQKRTIVEVSVDLNSIITPEPAYKHPVYDQSPAIDLSFLNN